MPVTLICPNLKCRTILQVPDKARGRKVKCGRCGRTFLVPNLKNGMPPAQPDAGAQKEETESTKK